MQRSAEAAVDPQTKPPDLGCESSCRQLSSIKVHRSSVNAEHRPNVRPKASAMFGSATLQLSAELWQLFGLDFMSKVKGKSNFSRRLI